MAVAIESEIVTGNARGKNHLIPGVKRSIRKRAARIVSNMPDDSINSRL